MTDAPEHAPVVVVGSGVAGALVAWALAARGVKVLILEAGQAGAERTALVGAYAAATIKSPRSPYADVQPGSPVVSPDNENDYLQDGTAKYKSTYLRRVGGTTWHMLGNMPRHVPADFRLKSRYGVGVDWPIGYDDLEPWYCDAEDALGVSGDHAQLDGMLGARRGRPFPMSRIWPSWGDLKVSRALQGLEIDGVAIEAMCTPQARNSRPYDGRPACAGNSSCVPICPIGAKYDATVHLKKAAAAGAELRSRAVVSRLRADPASGRITGLDYIDWSQAPFATRTLTADLVVLAANAIESPRLLLMSGVANASGQVGCNLMDHLQGQGAAILPEPVYPFRGPPTTVGIDAFRDGPRRESRAAFRMSIGNDGMGRTETPLDTLGKLVDQGRFGRDLRAALRDRVSRQFRISYSTEVLPSQANRLRLATETDAFGLPRPKLTVSLDDYNRRAFAEARKIIAAIFDRLGASETAFATDPDAYTGAGHIMGTCRMGVSPADSVVDADCRAHDHPNLHLVGASVFPTCGTANPTLTIAALALRAARAIGDGLGAPR